METPTRGGAASPSCDTTASLLSKLQARNRAEVVAFKTSSKRTHPRRQTLELCKSARPRCSDSARS